MAKNGSTTKTFGSGNYSLVFSWSLVSQDVTYNSSTINFSLVLKDLGGYGATFQSNSTSYIYVNGESFQISVTSGQQLKPNGSITLISTTTTIPHNSTDSQLFYWDYSLNWSLYLNSSGSMSFQQSNSGSEVIDYIVRSASIISVSPDSLTDEDNFTISYSNPAGTFATELQACISFTGGNDDIPYRDIPKTGSSYTFVLTDAEKNTLYNQLNKGITQLSVRFYIRSRVPILDGSTYETVWDYITKTITFVNYTPTLSPTVVDNNSDTIAVTGDETVLVAGMSDAYFVTGAASRKGATIVSQYVSNGDVQVDNAPSGTISNVTSNTFYFGVTDSRGSIERDFVSFTGSKWIPYVKPTCKVKTDNLTTDGKLTIHLSGKCFEGSFGAATNFLYADYKIYPVGGSGNWRSKSLTPTVDENNNYTASFTVDQLEYDVRYSVTIRVYDQLNTSAEVTVLVTSEPVFDWGKNDFRFHVPVEMDDGFTYPQNLLWSGVEQMEANTTIKLSAPVSEQSTGIVLVFSLYRDNVENASIHSFFVSRKQIELLGGSPHMFMMGINSNLSVFGSKYIYISDGELKGFAGNSSASTAACGITFDNTKFVLRYVIGV